MKQEPDEPEEFSIVDYAVIITALMTILLLMLEALRFALEWL